MFSLSGFYDNFIALCNAKKVSPSRAAEDVGLSRAAPNGWKSGAVPRDTQLKKLADYFGCTVEDLKGIKTKAPDITRSFVTFQIIGEVAAHYGSFGSEDWTNGKIDIPESWLHGRSMSDYFVLRVSGDSMYPTYQDGDLVLVLKQSTMDHSGQIGVVIYDDDKATLKRIEYVMGENWMRLIPINTQYPPVTIRDERLEHCRVLGIPKKLIRNIE